MFAIAPSAPTATAVPSSERRTSSNVTLASTVSGDHVAPPSCDRIMPLPAAIASWPSGETLSARMPASVAVRFRCAPSYAHSPPSSESASTVCPSCAAASERNAATPSPSSLHVLPVSFVTRNVPLPAMNTGPASWVASVRRSAFVGTGSGVHVAPASLV